METLMAIAQTSLITFIFLFSLINFIHHIMKIKPYDVPNWFKLPITFTLLGCLLAFIISMSIMVIKSNG